MNWEEYRGRIAWSAVCLALGIYLGGGFGWLGGLLTWETVIGLAQVVALVVAVVALARNTRAHRESHEQQRITNYLAAVGEYVHAKGEAAKWRARAEASNAALRRPVRDYSEPDPAKHRAIRDELERVERLHLRMEYLVEEAAPTSFPADVPARARASASEFRSIYSDPDEWNAFVAAVNEAAWEHHRTGGNSAPASPPVPGPAHGAVSQPQDRANSHRVHGETRVRSDDDG